MSYRNPAPRHQPRPPKKRDPLITGLVVAIIVVAVALGVVLYLA